MDFLDFPIQSLILNDLARNLASSPSPGSTTSVVSSAAQELIEQVQDDLDEAGGDDDQGRVIMTTSSTNVNTSFSTFCSHLPPAHPLTSHNTGLLLDLLRDIPLTDFEQGLGWTEWALPDQLTYGVLGALLKIAGDEVAGKREIIMGQIAKFVTELAERIDTGDAVDIITHSLPIFNGFYRSLTSFAHPFTLGSFCSLAKSMGALFQPSSIDALNHLLIDPTSALSSTEASLDPFTSQYALSLLARYRTAGRPLSGNFVICAGLEIQKTMLSQALSPPSSLPTPTASSENAVVKKVEGPGRAEAIPAGNNAGEGAEASNAAWYRLLDGGAAGTMRVHGDEGQSLHTVLGNAMRCAGEMLGTIGSLKGEPAPDLYPFEVISESLKLAALCSVAVGEPNGPLLSKLKLLVSDNAPVFEPLVQEAALQSLIILILNFNSLAQPLAIHLRRFVAAPLRVFESDDSGSPEGSLVLANAAKCLAVCIKTAPGDDLINSTLYSLLNNLSGSSGGNLTVAGNNYASSARDGVVRESKFDSMTVRTSGTMGGGMRTEEQTKQVNASTIAVVTRLAIEFKQPEVIHVIISMLLQRLRGADAHTEAIIVSNLVPLALVAPRLDFLDVIQSLSLISRSSNPEDPSRSSSAVLAAQTRLGRDLKRENRREPELCDAYLVELLQLFADRGTTVQMVAAGKREDRGGTQRSRLGTDGRSSTSGRQQGRETVTELTEQLSGLILPIDAVLQHETFDPSHKPSPELVALFRNMWFLIVVLGISRTLKPSSPVRAALDRIALKTPALVLESAPDYVESDLEYNSILKKDYADVVLSKQRGHLADVLPAMANEVRSFSLPQVTLLLTIWELEGTRTRLGKPSGMLLYFCNDSLNESVLVKPLDAIAGKIISSYKGELQRQAITHTIPTTISSELQNLLIGCTHRFKRVRDVAFNYLHALLSNFPTLMCDEKLVFSLLEILTIMRNSCEEEFTDEYSPVYEYKSTKVDITLQLSDSFTVRNEITTSLYSYARTWLTYAISKAPIELQTILQLYLAESRDVLLPDSVEMGAGLALHYSKVISSSDRKETLMPNLGGWPSDKANLFASQFAAKIHYAGERSGARLILQQGLENLQQDSPSVTMASEISALKMQMAAALKAVDDKTSTFSIPDLRRLLSRGVAILISSEALDNDILHYLVSIPMRAFSPRSVAAGVDVWTWLLSERPSVEMALLTEIVAAWTWTIKKRKGLFSTALNTSDPFVHPVEYSPSDKELMDKSLAAAQNLLTPHLLLLQTLSSRFQAVRYREPGLMVSFWRVMMRSFRASKTMSTHPLAREARFTLLLFGLQLLHSSRLEAISELKLRDLLYQTAFAWFAVRPQWSFGSNRIQVNAEIKLMEEVLIALKNDTIRAQTFTSSLRIPDNTRVLPGGEGHLRDYEIMHRDRLHLLQILIENEISRLSVWQNALGEAGRAHTAGTDRSTTQWSKVLQTAWRENPAVAVHLAERLNDPQVTLEIQSLVRARPKDVIEVHEALYFLLGNRMDPRQKKDLKWLLLWAAVPPVTAVNYFHPRYGNDPIVLQYAMRVLEQHPVQCTFFFVPQVVQALRSDALGYVERFIFETSKVSQLFCHQIIWNMKANTYKDDSATEPDPMKPMLDRMVDRVVASLSGEARSFYDREFTFFNEVTDISGKLKPFIKKTKPEKKAKIDEEMAKIVVDQGVYLPSNPDGVVVELDKKSGRPLQSHAKAPFMATFKVRKERVEFSIPTEDSLIESSQSPQNKSYYEVWQAAIFKVGDDCRQDVLALQIIAMFKNIFAGVGLSLYLFPYRVTATAPGCGVIDVVPNSTSRDEMGRAKVNDLLSFFVDEYGSVDTIPFQRARMNFIQSMAAYSVACYILQIKDRHNGNIMIDGEGHIVHIDFGFLFDIGPGGVKFEPSSFKLTHEMVDLMGGRFSQGYRMFQELTVKAFLAIRPHAAQLVDTVHLMLETGLPSFKGEPTIKRLRDRFRLDLSEERAAEYMVGVIKNAHENKRSLVYDEFQRLQNGIPYAS